MPRRLVNRSAPSATATPSRQTTRNVSLPEYQPPSCHHSPSHRLNDIPSSRAAVAASALLNRHLTEASRNLAHSAFDLQARLRERRAKLAQIRRRRDERGIEKTADEERLEEHVEQLEQSARDLTVKAEEAMRGVVDSQASLQDDAQALKDLESDFSNRRPPPPPDDGEEPEPPTDGPLTVYNSLRSAKQNEYIALTPQQRYALNNEYATFKKLWHLGMVGEDGPPLPDASRWFDARGGPVMPSADGVAGESFESGTAAGEDDDDDIAVAREVVSLVCPLTQKVMEEPYSNKRCKHTFEKAAIEHHLRVSGTAQCPQTGCDQMFSFRAFKDDFFLDHAMLRRIQYANEAENRRDYDDSRMYDEDEEENVISDTSGLPGARDDDEEEEEERPRGARSVSRVPKRERLSRGMQ